MFVVTRQSAKKARSASLENSPTSPLPSPRLNRKCYKSYSQETLLEGQETAATSYSCPASACTNPDPHFNSTNGAPAVVVEDVETSLRVKKAGLQRQPSIEITGEIVETFNPRTKFDTEDSCVAGVAFTQDGDLVVSDSTNKKVKVFDVKGQLMVECTIPNNIGKLASPAGVDTLSTGEIVVADAGDKNIKVFTPEGRLLTTFGVDLARPTAVSTNSKDHVIVADSDKKQIHIYRTFANKNVIHINKDKQGHPYFTHPSGVAVTRDDSIVVTDEGSNHVLVFDKAGSFLEEYTGAKSHNASFREHRPSRSESLRQRRLKPVLSEPRGVTNDRDTGVLVADSANHRVVRYDLRTNTLGRDFLTRHHQLTSPVTVASDWKRGRLAVVHGACHTIEIYKYLE